MATWIRIDKIQSEYIDIDDLYISIKENYLEPREDGDYITEGLDDIVYKEFPDITEDSADEIMNELSSMLDRDGIIQYHY